MIQSVLFLNPSAKASDCPDSWNIQKPNLVITSGAITSIDSRKGTENRAYTSSMPSNIESITGDTFANKNYTLFRGQEVVQKLKQLGSNAEISATYVSSTKSPFQNLDRARGKLIYGDWLYLFGSTEEAWKLRWMGLSNGTNLAYRVSILVKGCKEFVIDSNTYTFNDLPQEEFGIDAFFQFFESKQSFGQKLSFRQIEISRENLVKNIAAIKATADGAGVGLERIDRQIESVLGFLFVGMNPGGCLNVNDGGNSIPPWNAPYAALASTPCKVGVYSMYPDKGLSGVVLVTTFDAVRSAKAEAEAEAKAKAEAEAKAKAEAEVKAKAEAEAKAAAELKAKQEAEAKAKAEAAKKKSTITCVKGKLTKKVTAVKPKCPKGFKVKA
jgi:predicted  nucleic acid-binding Zn-ribbon protein